MTITNWTILSKNKKSNLTTDEIVEILLQNRGISTKSEMEEFFNPPQADTLAARDFKIDERNLASALKRLLGAKEKGEQIIVFGDYDADGVTATAILWQFLYDNGWNTMPFIPSRFEDGYGINPDSVEKVKQEFPEVKLIITVDNGIVACAAAQRLSELKVDLIITDHHKPDKDLPKAVAIVHTTKTSGAAIAWFLTKELEKQLGSVKRKSDDQLDLVAVGVVSDQMELTGLNRTLVKAGLKKINLLERPGIAALMEVAGASGREIGPYEIGFIIGPRINAAGRLGSALESLRLLCTGSGTKAHEYAINLDRTNKERQDLVEEVVAHAKQNAKSYSDSAAILIAHESYHEGVIGLAASSLVEEFYRPSIVFSLDGEQAKASARSISGFDIIANIRKLDKYLIVGGGHSMAAGFTIKQTDLEEFRDKFIEIAATEIDLNSLTRTRTADMKIGFESLDWKLLEKLAGFEPYGLGNFQPSFVTNDVEIKDFRSVGSDSKHVKVKFVKDGYTFDAIGFGLAHVFANQKNVDRVDILYNFEKNSFRGVDSMQLKLRDIKFV